MVIEKMSACLKACAAVGVCLISPFSTIFLLSVILWVLSAILLVSLLPFR